MEIEQLRIKNLEKKEEQQEKIEKAI